MKKIFNWLLLFVKGAIMGIANVIPGVSGGTLAVILGIYDKFISAISGIFKNFIKNILFLIPIVLGMGISIIFSSKVIGDSLESFPLATALFFVGLIIGGIPVLYKKIDGHIKNGWNILIFLVIFVALLLYTFLLGGDKEGLTMDTFKFDNLFEYVKLFFVGVVAAATMIIPGISGSMTLMVIGYYELVFGEAVGGLTYFSMLVPNMKILIPFGLGCAIGILGIAKGIDFLLKKFEVKTFFGIFGFVFASIIIVVFKNIPETFRPLELIIGLLLSGIGFFVSFFVSQGKIKIGSWEPFKKKEN